MMNKPAMKTLRKAVENYRVTYAAYSNDLRNDAALEAWDKATAEFVALIQGNEENIIEALFMALDAKDKLIADLRKGAQP